VRTHLLDTNQMIVVPRLQVLFLNVFQPCYYFTNVNEFLDKN